MCSCAYLCISNNGRRIMDVNREIERGTYNKGGREGEGRERERERKREQGKGTDV